MVKRKTAPKPVLCWRFAPILALALLLASGVGCGRTGAPAPAVAFDVQRQAPEVFVGADDASMAPLPDAASQPLPMGHQVDTDEDGQGLLTGALASGDVCRIFLFRQSKLEIAACPEIDQATGSAVSCQEEGSAVYVDCQGHLAMTPSGVVEFLGTWAWVIYAPEQQLTLVGVLEGEAAVTPVIDRESGALGQRIPVTAGRFLYTAPDGILEQITPQLIQPPRRPAPLQQFPALIDEWLLTEARVAPWMEQVGRQATLDGLRLPAGLIATGDRVFLRGAGGALEDMLGQQAVVEAVPWQDVAESAFSGQDVEVAVALPDLKAGDVRGRLFDPRRAAIRLREANLTGSEIRLLFPQDDAQLAQVAKRLAEALSEAGFETVFEPAPAADLLAQAQALQAAGEPVLWLSRR